MNRYEEAEFEARIQAALSRVRSILDHTRNPRRPADVPHRYEDKYLLAEFLARASTASLLQCLERVGLTDAGVARLHQWAATRSVSLRLSAREDCAFLREETRKVESSQELVTETRSFLGGKSTRTEKVVTTVTEYFWAFDFRYELVGFQGTDAGQCVPLQERSGRVEIKTATRQPPRPRSVVRPSLDVNLTWLLQHVDAQSQVSFAIDRTAPGCHTPRRNRQVEEALRAFEEFHEWCAQVGSYFTSALFPAQQEHGLDLSALHAAEVFVPVVPLLDATPSEGAAPIAYLNAFLEEERRSLAEKCDSLAVVFPMQTSVITAQEACLLVTLLHAQDVCRHFAGGVDHIESLLRAQLIAAIGKEVTPDEFGRYMDFHYRKLFKQPYRPQPFSYAIRRPDHDPEGALSLEVQAGRAMPEPVSTLVTRREARRPMTFALDASARVSFLGDRFLHAWVSHQFSGASSPALSLVARARQFSCFLLLVGRISSADAFEPRFAVIVQNKDVLKIPLMLEQIPTPKEFRDAIESLSPEQQRFAKAFRSMQLESTLFGVCVIQIKPQLERLLKLSEDSLTKEIKLTQDLLGLFMEHQIPSDLLSYDGPAEAHPDAKLARVKEYVTRMQQMIDATRQRELDEAREREAFRLAEANRTAVPVPPPPRAAPMFAPSPSPMMPSMPMGGAPMPPSAMMAPPGMSGGPMPQSAPRPAAPPPGADPFAAPRAPPPAPVTTAVAAPQEPPRAGGDAAQPPRRPDPMSAAPVSPDADDAVDYTRIPTELDRRFEALDDDSAMRPSIVNVGDVWERTAQKSLLAAPARRSLSASDQRDEKSKAFDLIDALSKSGAMPFEHASLHVVIVGTHCFDSTLLDTVICSNVNPIEKVERSAMIAATTIHGRPAAELLSDDQRERFFRSSPRLGPPAEAAPINEATHPEETDVVDSPNRSGLRDPE